MTFVAIDHVQLLMPPDGEPRAIAFYSGVLGLDRIPKPGALQLGDGLWFRSGGVELHLSVATGFEPSRRAHPGLRVEEVDRLAERCEAAGHHVQWDERYPGVRRFYVHDPFGNRIEILQPDR